MQADDTDTDIDDDPNDDVALSPGAGADSPAEIGRWIDPQIRDLYEVHSYRHAASILKHSHPSEYSDIVATLLKFRLSLQEIKDPGGNETAIVKRVTSLLRATGWQETRIFADLKVTKRSKRELQRTTKVGTTKIERIKDESTFVIPKFVDGHKIDFVRDRVAFDMEWNSKDQTFDRDLVAFGAFYNCNVIGLGVLLTRSAELNAVFAALGKDDKGKDIKSKYGASTTWMGKLLYRLNAGRNGGCPVLVFGITPRLITDWEAR